MRSRHFEVLAFCAMLLAAAALFVALLPTTPAASAQQADAPAALDTEQTDTPATFNYQGILRNPDGSLMNGSHNVTIRIYEAASGGTTLHTEEFTNIPVRDGLFNVVVNLEEDFGNPVPMFIGVSIDDSAEFIPRQRVHPVPWALLADKATTLVPGASVVLNDSVLNDTTLNGKTKINGDITVHDQSPVLVLRYTNQDNNTEWSTGVPVSDYTCTMGGWGLEMDFNLTNNGDWSRWLYIDPFSGNWHVRFESKVHASTPNSVNVDVICFRKEITGVQIFSNAITASDIGPGNAPADATSASEDAGQ